MYRIVFTEDARKDLKELKKKAPYAIDKLSKLLEADSSKDRYWASGGSERV